MLFPDEIINIIRLQKKHTLQFKSVFLNVPLLLCEVCDHVVFLHCLKAFLAPVVLNCLRNHYSKYSFHFPISLYTLASCGPHLIFVFPLLSFLSKENKSVEEKTVIEYHLCPCSGLGLEILFYEERLPTNSITLV